MTGRAHRFLACKSIKALRFAAEASSLKVSRFWKCILPCGTFLRCICPTAGSISGYRSILRRHQFPTFSMSKHKCVQQFRSVFPLHPIQIIQAHVTRFSFISQEMPLTNPRSVFPGPSHYPLPWWLRTQSSKVHTQMLKSPTSS